MAAPKRVAGHLFRAVSGRLSPGDRLLFTTDGRTDVVCKSDLQRLLEDHADAQEAANRMIVYAELAGARGDATCIAVNCSEIPR